MEGTPSDPTGSGQSAQGNDVEDAAGGRGGVHVKAKAVRRMFEAQERTADVLEKLLMSIHRMATTCQGRGSELYPEEGRCRGSRLDYVCLLMRYVVSCYVRE